MIENGHACMEEQWRLRDSISSTLGLHEFNLATLLSTKKKKKKDNSAILPTLKQLNYDLWEKHQLPLFSLLIVIIAYVFLIVIIAYVCMSEREIFIIPKPSSPYGESKNKKEKILIYSQLKW